MSYQLTPEHAKLWLPVVRELRKYYEGKNDKFIWNCPLCKIINDNFDKNCQRCLWVLFEGRWCRGSLASELRQYRNLAWCKQSISRLKRWERRLEKIIKGEKS